MIHLPAVIAVIILLLPVSSASADPPSPKAYYGCWEISRIDWKPKPAAGNAEFLAVPQRILLSVESAMRKNTYRLLPAPGQPQTIHDDNYWQFESNGGVRLSWHSKAAGKGVQIILEPREPDLKAMKGIAKAIFDNKVLYKDPVVVYWWRAWPCQE